MKNYVLFIDYKTFYEEQTGIGYNKECFQATNAFDAIRQAKKTIQEHYQDNTNIFCFAVLEEKKKTENELCKFFPHTTKYAGKDRLVWSICFDNEYTF